MTVWHWVVWPLPLGVVLAVQDAAPAKGDETIVWHSLAVPTV